MWLGDDPDRLSPEEAKRESVSHDLSYGGLVLVIAQQVLDDRRHGVDRQPAPDFPTPCSDLRTYAQLDVVASRTQAGGGAELVLVWNQISESP